YEVPPLPRSLLKRLDQSIEAEWGVSPQLAPSPVAPWKHVLAQRSVWVRTLQVAASIAAVIALAAVFTGDARAYGWASMLEAWEKQGLVQLTSGDQTRGLWLAEGLLGQRAA